MNLGLAFQIVDDVLDYNADQGALGKTVGDDFREGKATLPVLLAYARGNEKERTFWRRVIEDLDQKDGDLEQALSLMQARDAITDSAKAATRCAYDAKQALLSVDGESELAETLADVADFCVSRAY